MTTLTPQAGQRYRRAAAFLIHWRDDDKNLGAEGALEILSAVGADGEDAADEFACALASLAWQMAEAGPDAAMEYLRRVAETSAVIEVSAGAGGEQG